MMEYDVLEILRFFMRIIAGLKKGMALKTPASSAIIRPALAKVREAIFSSLGDLTNQSLLDLFAGTGSLGLEALSRGAKDCTFVDIHPESLKLLAHNIEHLGFKTQSRVLKLKLPQDFKRLKSGNGFDVIFCDPPYDKNLIHPCLEALAKAEWLSPQTWILAEHSQREKPNVSALEIFKEKKFGQTFITYLRLKS